VLPCGFVALEIFAIGPAVFQIVVEITAILVAAAGIAPKIPGVGSVFLRVLGEIPAISGELVTVFLDVGSVRLGRIGVAGFHVLAQVVPILREVRAVLTDVAPILADVACILPDITSVLPNVAVVVR